MVKYVGEDLVKLVNQNLELILLPTEQCNCRCIYCNQEFKIGKMGQDTISGVKNLLSTRVPELNNLTIQWFGGEPLLAKDTVQDVMEYTQKLKKEVNPTINIKGMMTTNATHLNVDLLSRLITLGVNDYQISLDGNKEEHDKLRVKVGGQGTFDQIWNNLTNAHNTDLNFNITLRLHINKINEESMKGLLRKVSEDIGTDKRYNMFIRLLSRYGGKNDKKLPICEDTKSVSELKEFALGIGLNVSEFDPHKKNMEYICYASKPYAYVIRANGNISKCTVALYDEYNIIGRINKDGTMQIDNEKVTNWSRGMLNGNKDELACSWKFIKEENTSLLRKEQQKNKVHA